MESYESCINVKQLKFPFGQQPGAEAAEKKDFQIVYYQDQDEFTFWYKFTFTEACSMTFTVLPTNQEDEYDFLLYKYLKEDFCEAMVDKKVAPINQSSYEILPLDGNIAAQVHHVNQNEIEAAEGDVFYLAVANIYGENCGHRLKMTACDNYIAINSVRKPCFNFAEPQEEDLVAEAEIPEKDTIPEKKEGLIEEPSKPLPPPVEPEPVAVDPVDTIETEPVAEIIPPPPKEPEPEPIVEDTIIVYENLVITGMVRDNENGRPIEGHIVFTDNVNGRKYETDATIEEGYEIELERGRSYRLNVSSFGYYEVSGSIEFYKPSVYDYYLLRVKKGDKFIMNNIYFHPNTYALKDESSNELNKMLSYLQDHPGIRIEIQGHTAGNTDVRYVKEEYVGKSPEWTFTGSARSLSKLRAETVAKYLIDRGIEEGRLRSRGFGADQMLIRNPKSEAERRKNMRVEAAILSTGDSFDSTRGN